MNAYNQFYFLPSLNKWMSMFHNDCIECQQNKHINQKTYQTATIQTFSENASNFNYRISMDTKGPIYPSSKQNSYIHVIVDAFSHFVVTVPGKQNNAQNAVNSLLHHWITISCIHVVLIACRLIIHYGDSNPNPRDNSSIHVVLIACRPIINT